jgi:hypothetical protein
MMEIKPNYKTSRALGEEAKIESKDIIDPQREKQRGKKRYCNFRPTCSRVDHQILVLAGISFQSISVAL